jgi:hypothetical protein
MAAIDRPGDPKRPRTRARIARGFDYLTLDPSPRLRKFREEQEAKSANPAQLLKEAWESVGAALHEAIRMTRERINSGGH